ncbi:hypothetical protein OAP38_03125, partial [Opitutales bacterium]|nr:hypothetical protein [Opitutales bacterium]
SGHADSNTLVLNTGNIGGEESSGSADSSPFALNTNTDLGADDSGYADSNTFALNTSDTGGEESSGSADSNPFVLNTDNIGGEESSGFADSSPFALNTGGSGSNESSGYADCDPFALKTSIILTAGDDSGCADSNPFVINTCVNSRTDSATGIVSGYADSSPFDLDTAMGDILVNAPPTILTLSSSTIHENMPGGTLVGVLSGVDPDYLDVLKYSLILEQLDEVVENQHKAHDYEILFHLDVNGSLTTLRSLDFEKDPVITNLLIRVEDQYGAFLEKPFEIELLNIIEDMDGDGIEDSWDEDRDGDGFTNEFEVLAGTNPDDQYSYTNKPILNTPKGYLDENGSINLSGNVNFNGNGKVEDFGFVVSSGTSLDESKSTVFWVRGVGTPNSFRLKVNESPFSDVMYFRSWARNAAGYGLSSVRKVEIPEPSPIWWGQITEELGGWKTSDWFGTFIYYEKGWLYHSQLGWLYSSSGQNGSVWLWSGEHGWLWTKADIWPYLYKDEAADWLYFVKSEDGLPVFYDYSTSSYLGHEREDTHSPE